MLFFVVGDAHRESTGEFSFVFYRLGNGAFITERCKGNELGALLDKYKDGHFILSYTNVNEDICRRAEACAEKLNAENRESIKPEEIEAILFSESGIKLN